MSTFRKLGMALAFILATFAAWPAARMHASAAPSPAVNVTFDVIEPLEGDRVVYQLLAPSKIGGPDQGRISIRMNIHNNYSVPINITKIQMMGQTVSKFATPLQIPGYLSTTFQNFSSKEDTSMPLIISEPFPSTIKIAVFVQGLDLPVEKIMPLVPHINDGGPLFYPGKSNDLRQNETWGASSRHGSDHQVFALDTGVQGWDGSQWTERYPGVSGLKPEHWRAYGQPVYAMADGTVCWALNDHQEWSVVVDALPPNSPASTEKPISPSQGKYYGGGNQIFIKTGNEISVYAHLQPGSIPQELLQPGAPVKKGQYLGKVGYAGDTSHPHTHIHVKREPASGAPDLGVGTFMNSCDNGYFRPMTFTNMQSLTLAEANMLAQNNQLDASDWTALTNHSAPDSYGLLFPSFAKYNFAKNATDNRQYIGVWRAGDEIELRVKASGWTGFVSKWEELSEDNFRLVKIETFVENNQRQFMGLFKRGSGGHYLYNVAGWDAFTAKWNELSKAGLRLIDLATYGEGSHRYYVGVFRQGTGGYALWSITGWNNFTAKWAEFSNNGLRLIDLETFGNGNNRQYIGVFREGNDGHALYSITGWDNFTAKWDELSKNGLRLIDIETFAVGNQRQFIGVFRQGTDGYVLSSVTGYKSFTQESEKYNHLGLRLVDIHVEQ